MTLRDGLEDAFAAYDFLLATGTADPARTGVLGSSLGGYLATLVTTERPVKSLVLHVPAVYRDEWLRERYPTIERSRAEVSRYRASPEIESSRAMRAIGQYDGALFIIGGECDQIVPRNVTNAYHAAAIQAHPKDIRYVSGAGHRFDGDGQLAEASARAVSWFVKTLRSAPGDGISS
jgi:acetyl esterase/lipase